LNILSLKGVPYERIFVVGSLCGSYTNLINILYEQEFNHKDLLILTGNFISKESDQILDIVHFLKNNDNCYSVLGKCESDFLISYQSKELPEMFYEIFDSTLINFLSNLPLIIELDYQYFVVNAGLEPYKELVDQDERVFYSITNYDQESRYYQFFNPEKKSWYDFEFPQRKIIFSNPSIEETVVTAGYNLNTETLLGSLIITDEQEPIIIQLKTEMV
jgi:hypothetical protein